ncbi:hypothetical protein FRC09_009404 [Ceratobasidium sp. 395]|nr:hypothetical protein FRC09_009404 [Ceratobasidium sp. 395]
MSFNDFSRPVYEYRAYSKRDLSDRTLVDLVDLLERAFPPVYRVGMSDPSDKPLPKDDPRFNPPWLPERPPLPPRPVNENPFDLSPARLRSFFPRAHSSAQTGSTGTSADAPASGSSHEQSSNTSTDDHLSIYSAPTSRTNPPRAEHPTSHLRSGASTPLAQTPSASASASQRAGIRAFLPPLTPQSFASASAPRSDISTQSAPPLSAPPRSGHPRPTPPHPGPPRPGPPRPGPPRSIPPSNPDIRRDAASTPTSGSFARPMLPPASSLLHFTGTPPRTPTGNSTPTAAARSALVGLGWPGTGARTVTSSHGSGSASAVGVGADTRASRGPTPGPSSLVRTPSGAGLRDFPIDPVLLSDPLTVRDDQTFLTLFQPPASVPQSRTSSLGPRGPSSQRREVIVILSPSPSPPATEMDLDQPEDEDFLPDEDDEQAGGSQANTGPVSRTGGAAYVSRAEIEAHRNGPSMGQYRVYEFGEIILYVFEPHVPLERLTEALTPGAALAYCGRLSILLFAGKRSAKAVMAMIKKLREFFNFMQTYVFELKRMIDTTSADVESVLQQIVRDFAELRRRGIQIRMRPWFFYLFVRHNWYYWMEARWGDHRALQTRTNLHSGAISPPPHSEPSQLPTQLAQSSRVASIQASQSERAAPQASTSSRRALPPASSRPLQIGSAAPGSASRSNAGRAADNAAPPAASGSGQGKGKARAAPPPTNQPAAQPSDPRAPPPHAPPPHAPSPRAPPSCAPPPRTPQSTTHGSALVPHVSLPQLPRLPSLSALRAPRLPSSVRAERLAVSAVGGRSGRAAGSAGARGSNPRNPVAPAGDEIVPSDSVSHPDHDNGLTTPTGHEMAREQRAHHERNIQLSEEQLQFERRRLEIQLGFLAQEQEGVQRERELRMAQSEQERHVKEQEAYQRMALAQEQSTMDLVGRRVDIVNSSISSQHSMLLATAEMLARTVGTNDPNFRTAANQLVRTSGAPMRINLQTVTDRVRRQVNRRMVNLPSSSQLMLPPPDYTSEAGSSSSNQQRLLTNRSRSSTVVATQSESQIQQMAPDQDDQEMTPAELLEDPAQGEGTIEAIVDVEDDDEVDDLYADD